MSVSNSFTRIALLCFCLTCASEVTAQQFERKSPAKAGLMSFVVPGLGHRYVNEKWTARASILALSDVSTWLGIGGTSWRHSQSVDSYTLLAISGASAQIDGKDRRFFLNLATFKSSDAFIESALRNRAWDQLDYIADSTFEWDWQNDEDFADYRDLRERSETLDRRRSVLIAVLVANRAFSGISSMLAARKHNMASVSISAVFIEDKPAVRIATTF